MADVKTIEKSAKPKENSVVVKQENSVDSFITQALSNNISVEIMEKLFALREKAKAEVAKEAFVSAMAKFQSACPVIEKKKKVMDKDGQKVRYMYAPLDSIVSQVKTPLGNNNLFYSFKEEKDEQFLTAICTITHSLGHSETSSFKVPIGTEAYMNDTQKYGARMTFAKRYAFCNALGILTGDEDTDATTATPKAPKSVKSNIMFLLKELGEGHATKQEIESSVLKLTQLVLNDANLSEIQGRLEILVKESHDN